jgi:hypothetical protein
MPSRATRPKPGSDLMAGEIVHGASHGLAAPGGHYSHATSAGGLVFVSGQLPIARDGTKLSDQCFRKQTLQALANVSAVLASAEAGSTTSFRVASTSRISTTGQPSTESILTGSDRIGPTRTGGRSRSRSPLRFPCRDRGHCEQDVRETGSHGAFNLVKGALEFAPFRACVSTRQRESWDRSGTGADVVKSACQAVQPPARQS